MVTAAARVGILVYDGCLGAEALGFADLLTIANRAVATRPEPFAVSLISPKATPATAAGGVTIATTRAKRLDLLVVPGFDLHPDDDVDVRLRCLQSEVDYVRTTAAGGTRIASICVGAFLVGEAGLLDGRVCTTAWMFAEMLARRYPETTVISDELIVEHDDLVTSAAFSSAHDLALRLIGQVLGEDAAHRIARITLTSDARDRQSPYIDTALIAHRNPPFTQAVTSWLQGRLHERYDLPGLARRFNVSSRTLLRRFHEEMGISPLQYLQDARVSEAKRLLASTDLSVAAITDQIGYRDTTTFRRLFAARVGMTPAEFRGRFTRRPTSRDSANRTT